MTYDDFERIALSEGLDMDMIMGLWAAAPALALTLPIDEVTLRAGIRRLIQPVLQ